jgi:hypothetical protein
MAGDYQRGAMDIAEQTATFNLVMGLTKWGSLYAAALILLLVLWFCVPGAGFMSGLISAVVVVAIGTFLLRAKPAESH